MHILYNMPQFLIFPTQGREDKFVQIMKDINTITTKN